MNDKYNKIIISTTDTVVGIGTKVFGGDLEKVYELKNRPLDKKIIILVGSIEQAKLFSQWTNEAEEMAKQVWPGAVSLIVNNQGFRMPNQEGLIQFLLKEGPHYMTSANISGNPTLSLEEAKKTFPMIKKVYNFGKGTNISSKIIRVEDKKELR